MADNVLESNLKFYESSYTGKIIDDAVGTVGGYTNKQGSLQSQINFLAQKLRELEVAINQLMQSLADGLNKKLNISGGNITGPIRRENEFGEVLPNDKGMIIGGGGSGQHTGIFNGNGDGSAETLGKDNNSAKANLFIKSWYGVGFVDGCQSTGNGMTVGINCRTGNIKALGEISAKKVWAAVWNDYAEYRQSKETQPGRVICENGNGTLSRSTRRLQPGAEIISDTFGFSIGETETCKTPIAVSGRVLAYPWEDRNEFKAGDAVCSGPNGTVSKMTREEIKEYPERIVGTVSEIPNYETWGTGNVKINGRIWIRIR